MLEVSSLPPSEWFAAMAELCFTVMVLRLHHLADVITFLSLEWLLRMNAQDVGYGVRRSELFSLWIHSSRLLFL